MDGQEARGESWKKFSVISVRQTNGAHQDIVSKLRSSGHTEVSSPEDSDYLLVFCPIVSRVGTDICEALKKVPAGKPIILVVMHHTFKPDKIIADSRSQVDNPNVCLTVDCLYYEGKLLESRQNLTAWSDVRSFFGVSDYQDSTWQTNKDQLQESWRKFSVILVRQTDGAHKAVVKKLRSIGHIDVFTPEDSDYLVVFCPVVSGVGTDIREALQKVPGGKPVILVVMHHTSNPVSRGQVDHPNVRLTVDCLHYEGRFLSSKLNDAALKKIETFFGVESSAVSTSSGCVIL